MIKVAVIFLAVAVACGAALFASSNTPKSPVLHAAFIVSSVTFVAVMVTVLIRRASSDTWDSIPVRSDEPDSPTDA